MEPIPATPWKIHVVTWAGDGPNTPTSQIGAESATVTVLPATTPAKGLAEGATTSSSGTATPTRDLGLPSNNLGMTQGGNGPITGPIVEDVGGGIFDVPNMSNVSVVGELNSAQSADLLRIPYGPDTSRVGLALHPYPDRRPLDEVLIVLDPTSGRPIESMAPLPGSYSMSMSIPVSLLPAGSTTLLIKVALASEALGSSSSDWLRHDFLLQVTRQLAAATRGAGGVSNFGSGKPTTAAPSPLPGNAQESPGGARSEGDLADGNVAAGPTDPTNSPVPVSTGPLPARSAAALGGVLAADDPVPQIDPREAVAIDLDLIGLTPDGPDAPDPDPVDPVAEQGPAEPRDPLTPVRGPGGFPLLATAPGVAPSRSLAIALAALPWSSTPSSSARSPRPDVAKIPVRLTAAAEPPPPRPRLSLRASIGSGLTFALTLLFGLILPDLAAAFRTTEPPRERLRTDERGEGE